MNIAVPNRPLNPVVVALTGGALMAAAFWMIWTLLLWYRLHPHLPWRDLFVILDNILPLLRGETSWTEWQILTEPHYASHRIAIPRLLVALDLRFFHGQSHVLYTGAWLGIVACLGITMGMARGYFRQDRMSWYFCLGIVGILFFAPAHLWNLINAINASWHISFACAFISFLILLRGPGTPGPTAWALAWLCYHRRFHHLCWSYCLVVASHAGLKWLQAHIGGHRRAQPATHTWLSGRNFLRCRNCLGVG